MKQKSVGSRSSSEKLVRTIKLKTRRQYSAEKKIRVVLDGLRGEMSIAEMKH
jgi:transposase